MDSKKKLWLRIGVVGAVLIIIAAIFLIKNQTNKDPATVSNKDFNTTEQIDSSSTFPLKLTVTDLDTIKTYGVPTVIDFGSDSCIPCKQMAPVLETLNAEFQGKAAVQFMDVWKYSDGVSDFPVQVIPTQVFFNADGTPYVPSESLQEKIEFTMYSDKTSGEHIFTVHQGGITEEEMRKIFAEMGVK